VFVATFQVAALASLIMVLYADYPVALAPAMGLDAYFAFVVLMHMGLTWRAALGAVFISGCLFLPVTPGLRELIVWGIAKSIRTAISVGIGLFLAIIKREGTGVDVGTGAVRSGLLNA
jgi:AGZA family xanthine/uracil permease-like MFS transporter